jgi:Ca-activated chloride channel family protein
MSFLHPERIHLVWLVLALVVTLGALELRRGDALARFVSPLMQRRLVVSLGRQRQLARLALIGVSLLCGVLALMRPQTRGTTETIRAGRVAADIVVALDVSRSMLAEDAAPSRLARAKAELTTLLESLRGHRIGLVAFAGRAVVLCPLTPDYGFFRMILRGASPTSVSRGGTRIGDALRAAAGTFESGPGARLILLITDGEDHESFPLDAAKEAAKNGIRIVSIGFGSEAGSPITLVDPQTGARRQLVDRDGKVVHSRLDGELLRQIALATEGAYVPAGVAALDLESIVGAHIQPIVRAGAQAAVRAVPGEQYHWFILGSLAALLGAVWLTGQGRVRYTAARRKS